MKLRTKIANWFVPRHDLEPGHRPEDRDGHHFKPQSSALFAREGDAMFQIIVGHDDCSSCGLPWSVYQARRAYDPAENARVAAAHMKKYGIYGAYEPQRPGFLPGRRMMPSAAATEYEQAYKLYLAGQRDVEPQVPNTLTVKEAKVIQTKVRRQAGEMV